mmetsp:Transcript_16837/g.52642  ORF Transcript_16837/g.52642 Transcript_16837/m.52642 type:complete len:275 (+) Transcript_16837:154-978(+)
MLAAPPAAALRRLSTSAVTATTRSSAPTPARIGMRRSEPSSSLLPSLTDDTVLVRPPASLPPSSPSPRPSPSPSPDNPPEPPSPSLASPSPASPSPAPPSPLPPAAPSPSPPSPAPPSPPSPLPGSSAPLPVPGGAGVLMDVGDEVGCAVGAGDVGAGVGKGVGACVGFGVGATVGWLVGTSVGEAVGLAVARQSDVSHAHVSSSQVTVPTSPGATIVEQGCVWPTSQSSSWSTVPSPQMVHESSPVGTQVPSTVHSSTVQLSPSASHSPHDRW